MHDNIWTTCWDSRSQLLCLNLLVDALLTHQHHKRLLQFPNRLL